MEPISLHRAAAAAAVMIGSSPDLLREAIDAQLADARHRGETHEIIAFDAPKRTLQRLIQAGAHEMVGGAIQQAWATALGFQIVSNLEPVAPRPPSPAMLACLYLVLTPPTFGLSATIRLRRKVARVCNLHQAAIIALFHVLKVCRQSATDPCVLSGRGCRIAVWRQNTFCTPLMRSVAYSFVFLFECVDHCAQFAGIFRLRWFGS